ncbi:unnamed protein product [Darwinula stevensoni]|uniref:Breakpoint cluster region protein n=1 Tax=Darwinula stevensoni TaxID=69355 RepID=A0A7R9A4V6_9CRUS|nr:unnamed protein product [Darwinula stevensoni]CAG0884179.1 unnamed protein product [Darwinula stevensoni]
MTNLYEDFQQAWETRFPGSEVPQVWENDVRENLKRHRARLCELHDDVEKEEFYVNYLEELLESLERQKQTTSPTDEKPLPGVNYITVIEVAGQEKRVPVLQPRAESQGKRPPPPLPPKLYRQSAPGALSPTVKNGPSDDEKHCEDSKTEETRQSPVPAPVSLSASSSSVSSVKSESLELKPPAQAEKEGTEEPHYDTVCPDEVVEDNLSPTFPQDTFRSGGSSSLDYEETLKSQASGMSGDSETSEASGATGTLDQEESVGQPKTKTHRLRYLLAKQSVSDDQDQIPLPNHSNSFSLDQEDLQDIDSGQLGVYGSSVESTSNMPSSSERSNQAVDDGHQSPDWSSIGQRIIRSIIDSELLYLEFLSVLLQYMKALQATLSTSQPVLAANDFKAIFYRIPELYSIHKTFLEGLKQKLAHWTHDTTIGEEFVHFANQLGFYTSFVNNYKHSQETLDRCARTSPQFREVIKGMRVRSIQGQSFPLQEVLHKPISRVQKHAMVLQDLLRYLPKSHPDHRSLSFALSKTQCFLNEANVLSGDDSNLQMRHQQVERHLVKTSFVVELVDGQRKLRQLLLFNDIIVSAKCKASRGGEKFMAEAKWYIPLSEVLIPSEELGCHLWGADGVPRDRESLALNVEHLVALKSQVSCVRGQMLRQTSSEDSSKSRFGASRALGRQRKKLEELKLQLVLASPNLPFRVAHRHGRVYTFLMSSDYDRCQWTEAIHTLQGSLSIPLTPTSNHEDVQAWIAANRAYLKSNIGCAPHLGFSGEFGWKDDEDPLVGDLIVSVVGLRGSLPHRSEVYVLLELDSYGHFFGKARTQPLAPSEASRDGLCTFWGQEFTMELEGSHMLRALLYQLDPSDTASCSVRGKGTLLLSRQRLAGGKEYSEEVSLGGGVFLSLRLKFLSSEMTIRRAPSSKPSALFGASIQQVLKRERRDIPFIVYSCITEVERRGMTELGIYRVSGSASDINRLRKAFESNMYEAEQLVKTLDIHAVTGVLKLYLRELPEALFTDPLYPQFSTTYSGLDGRSGERCNALCSIFNLLPPLNRKVILFILDHLVKVHTREAENKMSLHNLAMVFGPTMMRPGAQSREGAIDPFMAGNDVMAQAGIIYDFLQRRAKGLPLGPPHSM